jgi:Uma2 family endonuclease
MGTDWHAVLQAAFIKHLDRWAPAGKVAPEWRFSVPPNDFETESVVPDVVDLAAQRYFALPKAERTYPAIPPEIVVEILSPKQSIGQINIKRRVYLSWGVRLVLIVDPSTRSIEAYENKHPQGVAFREPQLLTNPLFPTLSLPLTAIFAVLDEPA